MSSKTKERIYDELLVHPDYEFKHLDRVTYEYRNSDDDASKTQYCELVYIPDVAAFMLINFTDETFRKVKEGDDCSDFLYEVGIDIIEPFESDDNPY